ncbi:GNAT family N-acetyltransferase [Devosia sp. CAU 1758]
MSKQGYDIVDLRDAPQFFDTVADRIWRAWWEPDGETLADVEAALHAVASAIGYPFTLVATRDGRFLGTVTSIVDDIDARPHLGPCLAALWVEPDARGQGIAGAMAEALISRLADTGFERVYLSAKPIMRDYYRERGWTMIESDIDRDHQDVFVRTLSSSRLAF